MFVTVVGLSFRDGSPSKFFWAASEADPNTLDRETIYALAQRQNHGPFDSPEEAEAAAKRAIGITDDCEITDGGAWDSNWSKLQ